MDRSGTPIPSNDRAYPLSFINSRTALPQSSFYHTVFYGYDLIELLPFFQHLPHRSCGGRSYHNDTLIRIIHHFQCLGCRVADGPGEHSHIFPSWSFAAACLWACGTGVFVMPIAFPHPFASWSLDDKESSNLVHLALLTSGSSYKSYDLRGER